MGPCISSLTELSLLLFSLLPPTTKYTIFFDIAAMDNTALFNSERYSDLKIKLSSGKLISVHKIVVCRNIEYFDHLFGPDSRFSVSIAPDSDSLEPFHTPLTEMPTSKKASSRSSSSRMTAQSLSRV